MICQSCNKDIQEVRVSQTIETLLNGTKERIIRGDIIPCDDCPYLKEIWKDVEEVR